MTWGKGRASHGSPSLAPRPQHFLCQDFWRYRILVRKGTERESVCVPFSFWGEGLFGKGKHSVKMAGKKAYLLKMALETVFGGCMKKRLTFISGFAKSFLTHGVVAQLGERLNGIQEVVSSILSSSTRFLKLIQFWISFFYCMKWQNEMVVEPFRPSFGRDRKAPSFFLLIPRNGTRGDGSRLCPCGP